MGSRKIIDEFRLKFTPNYIPQQDEEAIRILKTCFPGNEIIALNCRVLIEQHGSLHCVTMQYPEPVKLNKKNNSWK